MSSLAAVIDAFSTGDVSALYAPSIAAGRALGSGSGPGSGANGTEETIIGVLQDADQGEATVETAIPAFEVYKANKDLDARGPCKVCQTMQKIGTGAAAAFAEFWRRESAQYKEQSTDVHIAAAHIADEFNYQFYAPIRRQLDLRKGTARPGTSTSASTKFTAPAVHLLTDPQIPEWTAEMVVYHFSRCDIDPLREIEALYKIQRSALDTVLHEMSKPVDPASRKRGYTDAQHALILRYTHSMSSGLRLMTEFRKRHKKDTQ